MTFTERGKSDTSLLFCCIYSVYWDHHVLLLLLLQGVVVVLKERRRTRLKSINSQSYLNIYANVQDKFQDEVFIDP